MATNEVRRKVRVRQSRIGGCGVFADQALGRGEIVDEVAGTVINDPNYSSRTCIDLGQGLSLETTDPFCYLNHACDPNCEIFEWDEARDPPQLWLQALRPIAIGEELTIDYAWHADAAIRCFCGSPACRGWVVDARELRLLERRGVRRAGGRFQRPLAGSVPEPDATRRRHRHLQSTSEPSSMLLAEFGCLWAEAETLWDRYQDEPAFRAYVSADYQSVYESLVDLRGSVLTVLEWGSGLGVATIMASRLGFEAYGIEAEPDLVRHAESLAQAYGPKARFAQGSFIPDEFEWDPANGGDVSRTMIDVASAYDDLGMELRDFDLVYAFPWPDEHTLYRNIIRDFGRRETLLLIYDVREGVELVRLDEGY